MFRISFSGDEEYKLVILMRKDLKMGAGKCAAQACHAALGCALASMKKRPDDFKKWMGCAQPKVVLRVDSEQELYDFKAVAEAQGLTCSLVADAGRTQIAPGSVTCLGIGPDKVSVLDKITGELRMY
ncbi:MAG: peptidyl-tRNA hydrolase Pth2 [Candidatus Methanoplasma sp.]|jgi:PTH2 family peptidyl-tRNA hydrolase|nr:peptidyl-tRNA hydrolase Pth2 [Candidatus Methanoplasma sp.]